MSRSSTRTSATSLELRDAAGAADLSACRDLFAEYYRALAAPLAFGDLAAELAGLPGDYARPTGRLVLALVSGEPGGCVALRLLAHREAEMKRLYVRPAYRGNGLGRRLAEHVISQARAAGYDTLRLDTLPQLRAAQELYATLGFVETVRYNDNPFEGVRFYALDLRR